jgi:chaperonin GroEL
MVYTSEQIEKSILDLLEILKEYISSTSILRLQNEDCRIESTIQLFFKCRPSEQLTQKLFDVILSHATQSEKNGPGSFVKCIENVILGLISKDFEESIKKKLTSKLEKVDHVTMKDVEKIISSYTIDSTLQSILHTAISMSGFKGRILIEKSTSEKYSVETVSGYTFDLFPAFDVLAKLLQPRILVIDGFIESVGEIHHLLEYSHESKESMLIFTRGFSPDVINTLKMNYDKGSLKIVPVVVKFDLDGLNTLNDLAVISGGDLVSSLKGDLISSIKYESIPRVDTATVTKSSVVLVSSSSYKRVSVHVSEILNRRLERHDVEDVEKLYDDRLKILSSRHVVVRIPDGMKFVVARQALDKSLRSIRSAMEHGVIHDGGSTFPTMYEIGSVTSALNCVKILRDLGAVVLL